MPGSSGMAPSARSSVRAVPPRPTESGESSPYRHTEWYALTPPSTDTLRPLVVNGPRSYTRCSRAVRTSTWESDSITRNSGTGSSRFRANVDARSSNTPSGECSSRTSPSVSTVIRNCGPRTTARGSATGREGRGCLGVMVSSRVLRAFNAKLT